MRKNRRECITGKETGKNSERVKRGNNEGKMDTIKRKGRKRLKGKNDGGKTETI